MTIKLTTEDVRIVGTFERMIGVNVRDCLLGEDTVYFLIEPGKMGMAIGRNGSKIKNISLALRKKVKVFEYADTLEKLVHNLIPCANSVDINNDVVMVSVPPSERSAIIGKNGNNIKMIRRFLNRHFNVKNLRLK